MLHLNQHEYTVEVHMRQLGLETVGTRAKFRITPRVIKRWMNDLVGQKFCESLLRKRPPNKYDARRAAWPARGSSVANKLEEQITDPRMSRMHV